MLDSKYFYAREKFVEAVRILAVGRGDVRERLNVVFSGPLYPITAEHLPPDLQEDYKWLLKRLSKFTVACKWSYEACRKNGLTDSQIEERFPDLFQVSVEATLSRIKNKTGAQIAERIYSIYTEFESMFRDSRYR